jgi:hypothetical protein
MEMSKARDELIKTILKNLPEADIEKVFNIADQFLSRDLTHNWSELVEESRSILSDGKRYDAESRRMADLAAADAQTSGYDIKLFRDYLTWQTDRNGKLFIWGNEMLKIILSTRHG